MWSPVERTALAEAEVEYADRRATQIYVKFPVRGYRDVQMNGCWLECFRNSSTVLIWTTTPWTIPANRAVSYSSNIEYGLYEVTEMEEAEFEPWSKPGDKFVFADDLGNANVVIKRLVKKLKPLARLSTLQI